MDGPSLFWERRSLKSNKRMPFSPNGRNPTVKKTVLLCLPHHRPLLQPTLLRLEIPKIVATIEAVVIVDEAVEEGERERDEDEAEAIRTEVVATAVAEVDRHLPP